MSNRLNQEREKELQPLRLEHYKKKIIEFGYVIVNEEETTLMFRFKDAIISVFPYSGWSSGKTITDCRGLKNLLKQIKK